MARVRLFEPIKVGARRIAHRVWMPPMCQYSALPSGPTMGQPTDWHVVHYGARALGGAAAVIVEATGVVPEGRISPYCLSLHSDEQIPAFARVADAIHAGGSTALIQLSHAGRKASDPVDWAVEHSRRWARQAGRDLPISDQRDHELEWQTVAPSAVAFNERLGTPRELTGEEIDGLIRAFGDAAERAMRAGFDGVQIHGAHGYLIHEFLSPFSNTRTDKWGGDFEGRTRFLRRIAQEIRSRIGDEAVLGVRLSGTDWTKEYPEDGRDGWTLEETVRLARELARPGTEFSAHEGARGVDMINMSTGGNVPDAHIHGGVGYQVFAAEAVRTGLHDAGITDVPVSAAGLITGAEQAEQILVDGRADMIEVGRPLLTDPMLPHVWAMRLRSEMAWPDPYLRGTARY